MDFDLIMTEATNFILSEKLRETVPHQGEGPGVILAMPAGEVHDIGKTVIAALFDANQVRVVDLGTVGSVEEIVEAVRSERPDLIGISCMLTSSLDQLQQLATGLEENGMKIPLLLGGPGITPAMVARYIAPRYPSGATLYVKDAQACQRICDALGDSTQFSEMIEAMESQHQNLRDAFAQQLQHKTLLPIEQARNRRLQINWEEFSSPRPKAFGVQVLDNLELGEIVEWIDWTTIFLAFGMKGKYPNILKDARFGGEAQAVLDDARALLQRILDENLLQARAVIGFFRANSDGDDIRIIGTDGQEQVLHCLRQQALHLDDKPYISLSDFIAPENSGLTDTIGAFALSCGFGLDQLEQEYRTQNDYYHRILAKSLADCLAEGLAEALHQKVRTEYWGYVPQEDLTLEQIFRCEFQGIRPAPGYPACPEHSEKELLFRLLDVKKHIKMDLTQSYAMWPAASVCGFYFAHPQAKYYWLGSIGRDQVEDYARRANRSVQWVEQQLQMNLNYINK